MSSVDASAAQPVGAAEAAGADWGMARVSRPEEVLPLGAPVPGALAALGALAVPGALAALGALAVPGGPAGAPVAVPPGALEGPYVLGAMGAP